jgi:hypothetical protein
MRISGLLGAVIALSVLTPTAPAHAYTISAGDLMYTDLFRWQGQDGTPTWREILAKFDCTDALARRRPFGSLERIERIRASRTAIRAERN